MIFIDLARPQEPDASIHSIAHIPQHPITVQVFGLCFLYLQIESAHLIDTHNARRLAHRLHSPPHCGDRFCGGTFFAATCAFAFDTHA